MDDGLLQQIRALPKIELHRHLEGAVRLSTLIEIAQEHGIEMPEYDQEMLRPFVQVMPGEEYNSRHFLSKFQTIRQFFRSPDVIRRVTREAVADAAADRVRYMELRFTPRALSNILRCSYTDVIAWVCEAAAQASADYHIETRLILSMNRHESIEIGDEVLAAAQAFRDLGVVAVDLAGDEAGFPALPFRDVFARARDLGLGVTIHAGEWGESQNVRDAILHLHAQRIGHGVRSVDDPELVERLAQDGIVLEVCPTSNVHSGVVADWASHPLPSLIHSQVKTTINTDDPLISNLTLSDEIARAVSYMALTLDDVNRQTLNAARAAFLPDDERAALVARFQGWLGVA